MVNTTNSEHLVQLQRRLSHLHTHPHKHKLLGVTNKKNVTARSGWSKVFADSNFGIEIAGKQKGTKLGLETWLLGVSGQPTVPGSPGSPHRLGGELL